jgi:flagellum-specific ATP synthase
MAVRQVPLIYEALTQTPRDEPSADPFVDLARHLKVKQNADAGD